MIDLTTIQAFEVPKDIKLLQEENSSLTLNNRHLKNILLVGLATGGVLIIYLYREQLKLKKLITPQKIENENSNT